MSPSVIYVVAIRTRNRFYFRHLETFTEKSSDPSIFDSTFFLVSPLRAKPFAGVTSDPKILNGRGSTVF